MFEVQKHLAEYASDWADVTENIDMIRYGCCTMRRAASSSLKESFRIIDNEMKLESDNTPNMFRVHFEPVRIVQKSNRASIIFRIDTMNGSRSNWSTEFGLITWSNCGARYMLELGPGPNFLSLLLSCFYHFFEQYLSSHFVMTLEKGYQACAERALLLETSRELAKRTFSNTSVRIEYFLVHRGSALELRPIPNVHASRAVPRGNAARADSCKRILSTTSGGVWKCHSAFCLLGAPELIFNAPASPAARPNHRQIMRSFGEVAPDGRLFSKEWSE